MPKCTMHFDSNGGRRLWSAVVCEFCALPGGPHPASRDFLEHARAPAPGYAGTRSASDDAVGLTLALTLDL